LPIRTWGAFAIVLLPWLIFAQLYFGTIIPRSVSAKTTAYIIPSGASFIRLIQNYGTPFNENEVIGGAATGILVMGYLALYAIGLICAIRKEIRLLPWLVYPLIYGAAFSIANPLIFRWYLTPPLPPLMFALLIGFWALCGVVSRSARRTVQMVRARSVYSGCTPHCKAGRCTPITGRIAPRRRWHGWCRS
jgi:hypothetical protein